MSEPFPDSPRFRVFSCPHCGYTMNSTQSRCPACSTAISPTRHSQSYGVAAGVISAASYGAMSSVVHSYGVTLPSTEVIFFRAIFALIALGPFVWRDRRTLVSKDSVSLWVRSFWGAVSILCFTWNLQHTSIGLANVLFNVAPLGVLLFGWMFRSERLTYARALCLLLVVVGSCVFWGDATGDAGKRVFEVGLGGAVAAAISYLTLKSASMRWSPMTVTWCMSLLSVPVTLMLKRGAWASLNSAVVLPLLLIAGLCTVGQLCLTVSYRWADLATATAIVPSTMAWGVLIDVISGSPAPSDQLIGCAIYLIGCIPLTMMGEETQPQAESKTAVLAEVETALQEGEV